MDKISIIVPFLNAEKDLEKCIKKLLEQTYKNIEIILINDNSKDNSEKIINHYKKNEKIKYYKVDKETTGVSYARNYGIEKATGKYLMFVDVDDYIDKTLIEKLTPYMKKNIEVIKFKTNIVNKNNEIINKIDGPVFESLNGEQAFNELCFKDVLIDSPCLYLMQKDLFIREKLQYEVNTYHEDYGLMPFVILNAKTVASVYLYGYNYVQSENSIIRNNNNGKKIKKIYDKLVHYDNMLKRINKFDKTTQENIKIYYTNVILLTAGEIKGKEQREYIKEIKKRNMINNIKAKNIKQLIKKMILKINIKWYLKLR